MLAVPLFVIIANSGCGPSKSNPPGSDAGTTPGNDAGACSGAPTSPASALTALTAALCPALAWEPDAFLVGIENGNGLGTDGNSQVWTVAFSSPSATCSGGKTTIGYIVDATRATVTSGGTSCLGVPKPLTKPTVDSTTVVPDAVAKIAALAGSATVTYSADINSAATASGGTSGDWRVTGSWSSGGGTTLVEESYDPGTGSFLGATCLEGCEGADAGPGPDGGTGVDAGPRVDGGADAGPGVDAGQDAGTDAGVEGTDAGEDAGPAAMDAGACGCTASGCMGSFAANPVIGCAKGTICNGSEFNDAGVSAGYCVTPQYTDNGDGTVTDDVTGLVWQAATSGFYTWAGAATYCQGLSLSGGGWRVPTLAELFSLLDFQSTQPYIGSTAFTGIPASDAPYWSSTVDMYNMTSAWIVDFIYGGSGPDPQNAASSISVRCVR